MANENEGRSAERREPVVLVDLHCHSDVSDGYYAPPALASLLAEAGINYAALTDHQSVAGLLPFHIAAAHHGIVEIVGAEVHATLDAAEIHLLAYGFDPENPSMHMLFGETPDAAQAIDAIHEAGGIVCLAHPLSTGWSESELDAAVDRLAHAGLDGIEAFYKPYAQDVQDRLVDLADRHDLLTCGGSDYHGPLQTNPADSGGREPGARERRNYDLGARSVGVAMPVKRWKQFREALGDHARNGDHVPSFDAGIDEHAHAEPGDVNWRWLALRIVLPSLLAISVFVMLLFAVLIPTLEERLLDRKREVTTELTNSAWSILADYHKDVQEGRLTRDEAQHAAKELIRHLRYGPEDKDYFWITDMHPRMIMHPYRVDLEGTDLTDLTDPEGVRPFVEFVNAVRKGTSGYVTYVWQWQDDPDRLAAKESYVRGFTPWGWIIGTGLYMDDVQQEIKTITGHMVDASFIVTVLATVLLVTVAHQSLNVERRRSEAARDLRVSHERYRALVEASTSGTLLLLDGRCTYANRTLLEVLGYSARELAFLDLHDIVVADEQESADSLELIASGGEIREPFEVRLRRKSGQTVPVLLSSTAVFFSGQQGMILSLQDITRHRAMQSEAARERLITQLQTSALFLTDPVRNCMDKPIACALDTPIAQVVRLMGRHEVDAVVVCAPNGEAVGILTNRDIRDRVVAAGLDTRQPVSRIMTAPVVTIAESAPLFEAFLLERERNLHHLAVTDGSGKVVGMIQSSRTLQPDRYSLVVLTHQIRQAKTLEELAKGYARLPALIGSLVDSGALSQNISHVATSTADAATKRVIALALEQLGPAPARFAFVVLGSQAREEQTLATDQDNALIFEDVREGAEEVARYFLRFGELVCDGLDQVGYRHCKGDAMAKNPRWNQALQQWKRYVAEWMVEPDGEALAHCRVFFDHRCIYGDRSLVSEWWQYIAGSLARRPAFLSYMALDTLHYKPPIGPFGQIVTGTAGEAPHTFNIKEAMLPIVNFARLYALKHQLEDANTFSRLEQLSGLGVLHEESYRDVYQAYSHLMQLRYRHQIDMHRLGLPPDNSIDTRSLSQIEIGMLKLTFSQISMIQKKVSFEFRGTA
jgi:PAS domain S-box-containing protein